jgi:predicted transcriptional regulator
MKTNKHQTLLLVKKQRAVHARDLVQHFAYSSGTARSYLSHLGRQGLLERIGPNYELTERGQDRLQHFRRLRLRKPGVPALSGESGVPDLPQLWIPNDQARGKDRQRVGLHICSSTCRCLLRRVFKTDLQRNPGPIARDT